MKQLLLIIFIVNCLGIVCTRAQTYQLIGVVMDSAVRKPISGAMVFVGHTSLRANTDRRGHFTIAQVPLGTVDVVASSSEHRPARLTLRQTSDSIRQRDTIWLRPVRIPSLNEVIATASANDKNRSKGLALFFDRFIGTSNTARACRLINPWVLEVQLTKQEKKEHFRANATDIVGIENLELGYTLHCYVEKFEVLDRVARFWGAVGFSEMLPNDQAQASLWQTNRARTYGGSLSHFLHTLTSGKTAKEGFYLYPIGKDYPYFYSARVPEKVTLAEGATLLDTTAFAFERKLRLKGQEYLQINYDREPEEVMFRKFAKQMANRLELESRFQPSWLRFFRPEGTVFNTAGWLCHPNEVDVLGYWEFETWGDRVPANFLPTK